jgi:hypothetical protein
MRSRLVPAGNWIRQGLLPCGPLCGQKRPLVFVGRHKELLSLHWFRDKERRRAQSLRGHVNRMNTLGPEGPDVKMTGSGEAALLSEIINQVRKGQGNSSYAAKVLV